MAICSMKNTVERSAHRLGSVAQTLFMGLNVGRAKKTSAAVNDVPLIHIKDVVDDALGGLESLEQIGIADTPQTLRQRLLSGDILLSARGTLMKCAVVPDSHSGAVASANFIFIRLGQDPPVQPELLWAFLRLPKSRSYLQSRVTGSAQSALNIRDLSELPIPVPPRDVQRDLSRLVVLA